MSKDQKIAEVKEEYVAKYLNYDYVCPYCGKEDGIMYDSVDFDSGHILQRAWCVNCDGEWVDTYKLVELTPLKSKEYPGHTQAKKKESYTKEI